MRRGKAQTADWANLLGLVQKDEQEELRQLLVASRQRKELLIRLIYQQRYKNILEFWLYIHIPFTILLLVFAISCTSWPCFITGGSCGKSFGRSRGPRTTKG